MKRLKKTYVISILALCLIIIALAFAYGQYETRTGARNNDWKTDMRMEGIRMTLNDLTEAQQTAVSAFETQLNDSLNLLSVPLRGIVRQKGDEAIQNYEYGCVVRKGEDGLVLPEDDAYIPLMEAMEYGGTPPIMLETGEPFEGSTGVFWSKAPVRVEEEPVPEAVPEEEEETADDGEGTADEAGTADGEGETSDSADEKTEGEQVSADTDTNTAAVTEEGQTQEYEYVLCAYRRLADQYYYVYYTPASEIETFMKSRVDVDSMLESMETVYEGQFLALVGDGNEYSILYGSHLFDGCETLSETCIVVGKSKSPFRKVTIKGEDYMYAVSSARYASSVGSEMRIVYMIPYESYAGQSSGTSYILLIVAFAFLLVLTVWVFAADEFMRHKAVTKSQRKRYGARRMCLMAASLCAVGFVVILLFSMFTEALSGIFYSTNNCQSALETMQIMSEENSAHDLRLTEQRAARYLSFAKRIAALLETYPELKTPEQLAEMSETTGADYLMLFDDSGKEILTDSRFVNLSYDSVSMNDFSRLIQGVPSIVHSASVDEVTGLYRQLIGVSMDDGDASNGYGSLIMAIVPSAESSLISTEEIMKSLTTPESIAFSVDRDTGVIKSASAAGLVGKKATEIGMNSGSLHGEFMDFFRLNDIQWYGCSVEYGGSLYYYAVKTESIFGNITTDGVIYGVMFVAAYAIMVVLLLFGYTDKRIDGYGAQIVDDHDWDFLDKESIRYGWWARKMPEKRAGFALTVLIGICLVALIVAVSVSDGSMGYIAVFSYVLNGGWTRAFNLFAMTKIVLLFIGITILLLGLRLLQSLLNGILDTKGSTISRLLCSLLKYVIIIIGIFLALESLGFDTTTLLASLGIFSLALSLGAKDLVADLLSGITIVFSGEYQIGDIVEIGGFRGRVWEIGIRTTTLVNSDGNMKNVSNRNVSDVLNLSRMNTRYTMQISIPYNQPLSEIKKILSEELPGIGREINEIASGPEYAGVVGIADGYMTLAFTVECDEQNTGIVRTKLNVAIKDLFDRHSIPFK